MTSGNLELLKILLDYLKYNEPDTEKAAAAANIPAHRLGEAFDTLGELIDELRRASK